MEQHPSLLLPLGHRLQDLTLRDLQKQEREKAANSLEAFIFETQVGGLGHRPASVELSLPNSWAPPHRTAADSFCEMVPTVHYRDQGTRDSKIQ